LEPNTLNNKSDSELVQLYLKSQQSAYFSILYNRYAGRVYAKCISLLKDETKAKDAMQDIFIKIFMNISNFGERSKFSTWVYSITYNYCIDWIRKQKRNKSIFSDEMEKAPDQIDEVEDATLLEMEVSRLKKVLEEIPPGDKAILLMKYQDGMSIKEIAEILSKTDSAVKMKIKRAKHKAKERYNVIFPN